MVEPSQTDAIRSFIADGHPLAFELSQWQSQMRTFGPEASTVLIDILKNGRFEHRPAAIYGLRAFGFEAWAEGFCENERYRIRGPGEQNWTVIFPKAPVENSANSR